MFLMLGVVVFRLRQVLVLFRRLTIFEDKMKKIVPVVFVLCAVYLVVEGKGAEV